MSDLTEEELRLELTMFHFSFAAREALPYGRPTNLGSPNGLDLAVVRLAGSVAVSHSARPDREYLVFSKSGIKKMAEAVETEAEIAYGNAFSLHGLAHDDPDAESKANNMMVYEVFKHMSRCSCGAFYIGSEDNLTHGALGDGDYLVVKNILYGLSSNNRCCSEFFKAEWAHKRASAFLSAAFYFAKQSNVKTMLLQDDATFNGVHISSRNAFDGDGNPFYSRYGFWYIGGGEDDTHTAEKRHAIRNTYESSPKSEDDLKKAIADWSKVYDWFAMLGVNEYPEYNDWMKACQANGAWMPQPFSPNKTVKVALGSSRILLEHVSGQRRRGDSEDASNAGPPRQYQRLISRPTGVALGGASPTVPTLRRRVCHSQGLPSLHLLGL